MKHWTPNEVKFPEGNLCRASGPAPRLLPGLQILPVQVGSSFLSLPPCGLKVSRWPERSRPDSGSQGSDSKAQGQVDGLQLHCGHGAGIVQLALVVATRGLSPKPQPACGALRTSRPPPPGLPLLVGTTRQLSNTSLLFSQPWLVLNYSILVQLY